MKIKPILTACFAVALTPILTGCNEDYAPMPTVERVEVDRYVGKWYEISSIPNRFQSMCASDTRAEYKKDGDRITVINRCRKPDGKIETAEGIAKVVDANSNAKLKVSFFRPFYGNYWILDLDPQYQWVLVGEPSRKYGWVLSRSMQIEPQVLQGILQKAESLGYKSTDFKATPQVNSIN